MKKETLFTFLSGYAMAMTAQSYNYQMCDSWQWWAFVCIGSTILILAYKKCKK